MDERKRKLLGIREGFDGDKTNFGFSVDTVTFKGGAEISLLRKGVTVVIGGNNAGKSSLLRDLSTILRTHSFQIPDLKVIQAATVVRYGNASDALDWFAEHTDIEVNHSQASFVRRTLNDNHQVAAVDVQNGWLWQAGEPSTEARIGTMAGLMVHLASSRQRFDLTGTVARRKDINDAPNHPLQIIERSRPMLNELNEILKYVFSAQVTFDRVSGNLGLRYGEVGVEVPKADDLTPEYLEALASLPHIATQGDGFVSAVGLLLPLITSWYPLILVDEPEAFLHPPQAYRLGQRMMQIAASRDCQLIVATHDQNFLAGILSGSTAEHPASILRLQREEDDSTTVNQVHPDAIKDVWSKPQLKFSNVLDGVFHDAVVVAENDRDCLFYESAIDDAFPESTDRLMFTPCYGKQGAPEIVTILRAASVPTVVVLDLDALNDRELLKRVAAALGATWSPEIDGLYQVATAEFRNPPKQRKVKQVLGEIKGALGDDHDATYNKEMRSGVQIALSLDSPWKRLKEYGLLAFKAEPLRAQELLDALAAIGIVLVEVGELERFGRTLGIAKGSGWVSAALEAGIHKNPESQKISSAILGAITSVRSRS